MKRIECGLAVLTLSMLAPGQSALAQNPTPAQEYFLARMDPPYILPEGVRVETDIVFASPGGRDLHLDLFAPESGTGPLPAILFIQGSGYNGNNKASFWREAAYFATRGFIGISIEHRGIGPDGATWPSILADGRAGLEWMRSSGTGYGVDPERIALVGQSSGGHLAAMLGVAPDAASTTHSAVRGVVAINPLLDPVYFAEHEVWSDEYQFVIDLVPLFGGAYAERPELWRSALPIRYVSNDDPPFLIFHGVEDGTLPIEQIESMHAALTREGVAAEFIIVEGGNHEMLNNGSIFEDVLQRMERFLTRVLKPAGT